MKSKHLGVNINGVQLKFASWLQHSSWNFDPLPQHIAFWGMHIILGMHVMLNVEKHYRPLQISVVCMLRTNQQRVVCKPLAYIEVGMRWRMQSKACKHNGRNFVQWHQQPGFFWTGLLKRLAHI